MYSCKQKQSIFLSTAKATGVSGCPPGPVGCATSINTNSKADTMSNKPFTENRFIPNIKHPGGMVVKPFA
jgi:hypothetical protein